MHAAISSMAAESSSAPQPSADDGDGVVVYDGQRYNKIQEGLATILVPEAKGASDVASTGAENGQETQKVFYNPIQQFNRDLSVLAIRTHGIATLRARAEAFEKKMKAFEDKKRKRQEQKASNNRQQKAAKISEQDDASGPKDISATTEIANSPTTLEDTSMRTEGPAVESGTVVAVNDVPQAENPAPEDDASAAKTTGPANGKPAGSQPKLKILDALSATGLRALRYAP